MSSEKNILSEEKQRRPRRQKLGGNRRRQDGFLGWERWFRGAIGVGVVLLLLVGGGLIYLRQSEHGERIRHGIKVALGEVPMTVAPEVVEKIVEVEKIVKVEVPVEAKPEPLPDRFVAPKEIDMARLYGGLEVRSRIAAETGASATVERDDEEAYMVDFQLRIQFPEATRSFDELAQLNPELPAILPELPILLENAKVSGFFHELYRRKREYVQKRLTRLDHVLSRHNFFDCETVLELEHPSFEGKALFMQGEMDVVSDGSDGDRWPDLDEYVSMTDNYQPFTSYAWPKVTSTPNPIVPRWKKELKEREDEFAIKGLSIERNRFLRSRIAELKRGIADMENRSFLIAEADPFVVLPLSFLGRAKSEPFGPAIGDFAVVIYEGLVYPAIVGDAGPSYKMGEGSLRLARQLNEKAGPYSRPVSDLKVSYLIFPGSADSPRRAPDLEHWRARCAELIEGLGGLGEGYALHEWEDLIAKRKAQLEAAKTPAKEASGAPGDSQGQGASGQGAP